MGRLATLAVFTCVVLLLAAVRYVAGQTESGVPLLVPGEGQRGEITFRSARYRLPSTNEIMSVQVVSGTPDFFPFLLVYGPTGVLEQTVQNSYFSKFVLAFLPLTSDGEYVLEVRSVYGNGGQFVITAQPTDTLPDIVNLTVGQPITDTVSADVPLRTYNISGSDLPAMTLSVTANDGSHSPAVTFLDGETKFILGAGSGALTSISFGIQGGYGQYAVHITYSGSEADEPYTILLNTNE